MGSRVTEGLGVGEAGGGARLYTGHMKDPRGGNVLCLGECACTWAKHT